MEPTQTDTAPLTRSLTLLWDGLPETNKGPKPSLRLAQIIEAAIAVADAEGLDGLTMRRLATELGIGTMSLYRYVPGKAELLDLMLDHVSGPPPQLSGPSKWREVLHESARQGRQMYLDHPWLLQVNWSRPALGPNSLAGLEHILSRLHDLPLADREKLMLLTYLDGYVVGLVRQELQFATAAEESGVSDEEFWNLQLPWLERAMTSGDYPTMAQMDEDTFSGGWDEQFEFGLGHLLDGLELDVARRTSG